MSRLTKKDYKDWWHPVGEIINEQSSIYLNEVNHKLGKLEDIEDELYGVPLEFILTPASKGTKQVYWNNSYHDVRNIVPYEEHTKPYVEIFVRTNNKVNVKTLRFENYKKTWWLKEDLSE